MPRYRSLAQVLSETRALRGVRNKAAERISDAKRRKLAPRAPEAAISAYQAHADRYAARVAKLVERHVVPHVSKPAELELGLARLQLDMLELATKMRKPALVAGRRALQRGYVEVGRMMQMKVPRDVRVKFLVDDFATENVQLFRGIADDQVARIRASLAKGEGVDGARHALWVSRHRARLIATDQTWKFFGQQIQMWSRIAGSDAYVYVDAHDERVRASHHEHNGKVFRWASPPSTGHPGTEPNCRCRAIPVESPMLP